MKFFYRDDAKSSQEQLRSWAGALGLPSPDVDALLASGFIFVSGSELTQNLLVCDTYYGTLSACGILPLESLLERAAVPRRTVPRVPARSIQEIVSYLEGSPATKQLWASGRLAFRGQEREFSHQRPFRNPSTADKNGEELLLLPSHWRQFRNDFISRHEPEFWSIFSEVVGRNFLAGPLREVFDRFSTEESYWHHFHGEVAGEFRALEQHYGFPTTALDVTFDVRTAAFFARNRFVVSDGLADYVPLSSASSVLYVLHFPNGEIASTAEMITHFEIFKRYPPVRPVRQSAALVHHGMYAINHAACAAVTVFELSPDFDTTDLPTKEELFPSPADDAFFAALLAEKRLNRALLADIVEYSFHTT